MRLTSVRIQNYKCIEDSGKFKIDDVTCFVGKNEAGKSTLLQALYKLNPSVEEDQFFDPVIEYPRRLYSSYKERHEEKPDNVLTTEWTPDKKEREQIKRAMRKDIKINKIIIKKGYDNIIKYDLGKNIKLNDNAREDIFNKLPTFVYFTDYYKMLGNVSLTNLNELKNQNRLDMPHRIFIALLNLVGTTPEELNSIGRYEELAAELEAVSNRISQEIFEYWSQNRYLEVDFRFDQARSEDPPPLNKGLVFRTRIRNTRHGVTVSFDERSAGFVWFFSFLVWFSQLKKEYGKNLVILLDDPGLTLHAKAQADLLRYINEKLNPDFQVIFTTHSPFMIDPENILSVRTVEDVVSNEGNILGTKIREDVLTIDPDTIFPLQAALGYDLTQTLFVGKNVLLVEGPSDLLYFKWFSRVLYEKDRIGLDSRWTITPSGGINKVGTFMRLFGSNDLNVAIFTDFNRSVRANILELKKSGLMQASHVFSADMFVVSNEADIEDLIGRDSYVHLINKCYSLKGPKRISRKKSKDAPERVIEEVQIHLDSLSIRYDHYTPASFLTQKNISFESYPSFQDSLDIFEKLFTELNRLL